MKKLIGVICVLVIFTGPLQARTFYGDVDVRGAIKDGGSDTVNVVDFIQTDSGVVFPDGTVQKTAGGGGGSDGYLPQDPADSNVDMNGFAVTDTSRDTVVIARFVRTDSGVVFPDGSIQTTASSGGGGGGTVTIQDNGAKIADASILDFQDQLSVTDAGAGEVEIKSNATNASAVAENIPGCIQNGGFQLAHADIDGDSVVKLEKGGNICLGDPDSDYFEQVNMSAGDTLDLDVDLINGTTRNGDQWYEVAVMGDSDGVQPTKLVAYDSTSTPTTQSELETGYELFVSLGSVRSAWIRTRSDSTLLLQDWVDDYFIWRQGNGFGDMLSTSSPSESVKSVTAKEQIPPRSSRIAFNLDLVQSSSAPRVNVNSIDFDESALGSKEVEFRARTQNYHGGTITLRNVNSQQFFYMVGDSSRVHKLGFHPVSYVRVNE